MDGWMHACMDAWMHGWVIKSECLSELVRVGWRAAESVSQLGGQAVN